MIYFFGIFFCFQDLFALATKHWNVLDSSHRQSFAKSKNFYHSLNNLKEQNPVKKQVLSKTKKFPNISEIAMLEKQMQSFPWTEGVFDYFNNEGNNTAIEKFFFNIFESNLLFLKKIFIEKFAKTLNYQAENNDVILKETALSYVKKQSQEKMDKGAFKSLFGIIHHILMNPFFHFQDNDLIAEEIQKFQMADQTIKTVISKFSQKTMTPQKFAITDIVDAFAILIKTNQPFARVMKYYDEFLKSFVTQHAKKQTGIGSLDELNTVMLPFITQILNQNFKSNQWNDPQHRIDTLEKILKLLSSKKLLKYCAFTRIHLSNIFTIYVLEVSCPSIAKNFLKNNILLLWKDFKFDHKKSYDFIIKCCDDPISWKLLEREKEVLIKKLSTKYRDNIMLRMNFFLISYLIEITFETCSQINRSQESERVINTAA